jgi:hypothetical protein
MSGCLVDGDGDAAFMEGDAEGETGDSAADDCVGWFGGRHFWLGLKEIIFGIVNEKKEVFMCVREW